MGPRTRAISWILLVALIGCEKSMEPTSPPPPPAQVGEIRITVVPEWIRPSWTLLTPGKEVIQGAGTTTLRNLAIGNYVLTWLPLNGWDSPSPTSVTISVQRGQSTSTQGTYLDQPEQTPGLGTVHIAPMPAGITAGWSLEGPNGQRSGVGATSLSGQGVGEYTITWTDVEGYQPPPQASQTLQLLSESSITFNVDYVPDEDPTPQIGTIRVQTLPAGTNGGWTLSGPGGYQQSGSGTTTLIDLATGNYSVSFENVSGRLDPAPSSRNASLSVGATVVMSTFYGDPDAPSITDVDGSLAHGAVLTLSGSAFGQHSLDIEWTGDWIEAQANGTDPDSKAGWSHVYSAQGPRDQVTSNRAWSGNKSIDLSIDQTLSGGSTSSTLSFLHSPFESIYVSWWTWIQPTQHIGGGEAFTQLKYAYVTCDGCFDGKPLQAATNSVMNVLRYRKSDSRPISFHFENNTWIDCPGVSTPFTDTFAQAYGIGYTIPWSYYRPAINGGVAHDNDIPTYAPSNGAWTRVEMYAYRGSGPDVPDGELMFTVIKPGQGRLVGHHTGGVVLQTDRNDCRSEPADWERFVFFHFFDDPSIGGGVEKCTINVDDVYLQFGSRARVELGDQQVYSSCSRLEVQPPVDWTSNEIRVRANYGGFSPGNTAYLFVIREDGSVSGGYQVQL